jgi:hypothetical protein
MIPFLSEENVHVRSHLQHCCRGMCFSCTEFKWKLQVLPIARKNEPCKYVLNQMDDVYGKLGVHYDKH